MTGPRSLQRFLTVNPVDAGCAETFEILDRFAERMASNDAQQRFPDVAAHLRACTSCSEDLDGLLQLSPGTRVQ